MFPGTKPHSDPSLEFARELRRDAERLLADGCRQAGVPVEAVLADFDERRYLYAHPDVASAVGQGKLISAYQHWIARGWKEGRSGGPPEPVSDRARFRSELERRSMGINLYGNLSAPTGLGGVARAMEAAASGLGLPVNRVDILAPGAAARPIANPFRVNLVVHWLSGFESFLATHGTKLFEGAYNIGQWSWELPAARQYWTRFFRYFEEIWVLSVYCRNAFQCLTNLPVVCVPPVIDGLERGATLGREHFGFPSDVFVFTYVFDVGSYVERKNPLCLIRAFRAEFGDSTGVLLYLKVSNARVDPDSMRQIEAAIQGAPNIRLRDGIFPADEIASLHRECDCLVSPHRSEGFGMNMAETMYFGKPAIATGYSANVDFMNDSNGYLIDYRLVALPATYGPYPESSVWAEPSVEHLRLLMRRVLENPDERARKGEAARETIREKFSAGAIERVIDARLNAIGIGDASVERVVLPRHPERPRLFPESMSEEDFREALRFEPRTPVSILMTASGAADSAAALAASVESVREQRFPLWELCIVEDGSGDAEVRALLESLRGADERIKVLLGFPKAFEKAVEISRHELLMELKAGDVWAPTALSEALREPNRLLTKRRFYT